MHINNKNKYFNYLTLLLEIIYILTLILKNDLKVKNSLINLQVFILNN